MAKIIKANPALYVLRERIRKGLQLYRYLFVFNTSTCFSIFLGTIFFFFFVSFFCSSSARPRSRRDALVRLVTANSQAGVYLVYICRSSGRGLIRIVYIHIGRVFFDVLSQNELHAVTWHDAFAYKAAMQLCKYTWHME